MATAIFFDGRRLNVPQAVTKIDASALASVSPAATGIIALVGTAEGGKPLTVEEQFTDATSAGKIQERYRAGNLRVAGTFVFEPSADPAVPGGAQRVLPVKVNPAEQAGLVLPDDNAVDSLDITSTDWGERENQKSVEVEAGTTQGKKYTVVVEDTTEVFDDVGGDSILDALYTPGAEGYAAITGAVDAASFTAVATKGPDAGLATERTADIPAPGVLDVVSSAGGDTTQSLTVYGLDGGGAVISETIALNGTTNVQGLVSFTKVIACRLDAATAGTVTVSDFPISTTLFTLAPATLTRGILDTTNTPAAGVLTASIDVDTAVDLVVLGTNAAGGAISERFDMTTGNTTPVVGATTFARITSILLGDIAAARSITITLDAVKALFSTFSTVAQLVDRLNTLDGFTANANVSNFTTFLNTDLDYHAAPARPAPSLIGAAADFYADLFFGAQKLTRESALVNAARSPGGQLPPANTAGALFLVGGTEGVTTITEWQTALTELEKRRYNTLVVLSEDPAVHNLALTHLLRKNGVLKSEADGIVGIGTGGAGETLTNIKAQIQALNTRHLSAVSQEVQRFDPDTGVATWYPPYIHAAIAAGMQAGSALAEPLTRKTYIAQDIRNDPSWSVTNDVSSLIDAGLMVAEKVDGVGIRWVRSITTHLADDNLAFVERSANESVITAVFRLRNALEQRIGTRGLASAVGAIQTLAAAELDRMVDEEVIVAWKALQVEQVGDVFPVSVQMQPVGPVNFIPITVHLQLPTAQAA